MTARGKTPCAALFPLGSLATKVLSAAVGTDALSEEAADRMLRNANWRNG